MAGRKVSRLSWPGEKCLGRHGRAKSVSAVMAGQTVCTPVRVVPKVFFDVMKSVVEKRSGTGCPGVGETRNGDCARACTAVMAVPNRVQT
jgi:hypothetical protein